jgi:NADH-quinone oxidoreductase subunit L
MDRLLLLLPLLPLVSALLTQLLSTRLDRGVARISVIGGLLTFLLAASLLVLMLGGAEESTFQIGDSWGSLALIRSAS